MSIRQQTCPVTQTRGGEFSPVSGRTLSTGPRFEDGFEPPSKETHCTHAADWVSTKLPWKLAADNDEVDALTRVADACTGMTVTYEPAP